MKTIKISIISAIMLFALVFTVPASTFASFSNTGTAEIKPGPKYVWVPGHYSNKHGKRIWVPGHWKRVY